MESNESLFTRGNGTELPEMKTTSLDEETAVELDRTGGPTIDSMFKPETGERAAMIPGDEDEVATRIVDLLKELGKV